jgi:hypothetical protein
MATLKTIREKYKNAETERIKEVKQKKAELMDSDELELEPDPYFGPSPKKMPTVAEANKTVQLKK